MNPEAHLGRMQRRITVALTIVFLAAGCVDKMEPSSTTSSAEPPIQGAEITDDLGAIEGLVLDEQLSPVANASLALETSGGPGKILTETISDEAGAFRFALVEPGTYRVRAAHPSFAEAAAIAQVVAGEVAKARVTMTQAPSQLPYIDVFVFNGITGCDSIGSVVTFFVVGGICPTQATAAPGFHTNFTESWRHIVWENTWDAANEGLGFLVSPSLFTCDQEPCYGVTVGPPPLRLEAMPGQKMQEDVEFYNAPTGSIIPYPDGAFETDVFAYHGGLFSQETTQLLAPTGYCPDHCYGVGTTLERRFTIYQSTFHFEAPPEPARYSALPDA